VLRKQTFLWIALAMLLASCSSTYRVVQIPERNADMFPRAQRQGDVTVAIDEIRSAARAQRYFGANLIRAGILPVNVVVSNNGKQRVSVKPADILLHRGQQVIDPLPLQTVVRISKDERWFMRKSTEERVENFFGEVAFKETVLMPNETYQGVMFFSNPKPRKKRDRFFSISSLFAESGPRIRVAVTGLDDQQRMHFGPFSLTAPPTEMSWAHSSYLDRW
jgi:hypothetical protein